MNNYVSHFDGTFKIKLQKDPTYKDRYVGFRKIFSYLENKNKDSYTIIETGGIRQKDNWSDGQSSVLFYDFLSWFSGELTTIDVSPRVEVTYRNWLYSTDKVKVNVITGDGAVQLGKINKEVDLLYLDSFDIDHNNPKPSMDHHLEEFIAAEGIIKNSGDILIAVDDNFKLYGKGKYVLDYALKYDKEILHNGYQIIFKM